MSKQPYEKPRLTRITSGMPGKFGVPATHEYTNEIDGVGVESLMDAHGSPLFVFSEATIRDTYRRAHKAFSSRYPKVQFAWSYKTNYNNAICRIFHQEGSWAEVVSGFEYHKALGNDVPPEQIIFNGPDKTDEVLALALEKGSLIHIDHYDEIEQLKRLASASGKRPRVAIRVNLDTGVYPLWDRFGFNYENGQAWQAITTLLDGGEFDLVGVHSHIGTYMQSLGCYETATRKLMELLTAIKLKYDHKLAYIDLGGGFAGKNTLRGAFAPGEDTSPDFDAYAETITQTIYSFGLSSQALPTLLLETGRALIDDAGYLLGTVLANKTLAEGGYALVVDVGVHLLFTAFWYEHKITPVRPLGDRGYEQAVIYGPLCMNIDVVRSTSQLPAMHRGDRFVVHRVGAYNITQWLQFIHMRPRVVLIDTGGEVHLIREAESLEYLESVERLPPHLTEK